MHTRQKFRVENNNVEWLQSCLKNNNHVIRVYKVVLLVWRDFVLGVWNYFVLISFFMFGADVVRIKLLGIGNIITWASSKTNGF